MNKKTKQKNILSNSIIKEVNSGIANYFYDDKENFIEVNKNLKKYPRLYRSVIAHELEHAKSKNKYIDVKIELKEMFNPKEFLEMFMFSLKHPRAFLQLSPILKNHRGHYSKDNFVLMMYLVFIILFGGLIIL